MGHAALGEGLQVVAALQHRHHPACRVTTRQRVQFIATDAPDGARWLFNGKEQARGARWGWLPWPGRYKVELVDAKGQVLDETSVEVRGAGVRQQK